MTHGLHGMGVLRPRPRNAIGTVAVSIAALAVLTGCSEEEPAGPDVVGMVLPEAKKTLKQAGVTAQVHTDAAFGVLIEENFVVCEVVAINERTVRLEVSNDDCQE